MFELHNSVFVECGDYRRVSANEVLDIKTPLKNRVQFAKYIVFGYSGGNCVKAAELRQINPDPLLGVMSAEYTAALNGEEYVGEEFTFFGLSHDGVTLCNRAEFEPFVKSEGRSLYVSITLFLKVFEEFKGALVGGDNQLVRFLLGSKDLGQVTYFKGICNHPLVTMNRARGSETLFVGEVLTSDSGFEFCANGLEPIPDEVVFAVEGKAVLRCFLHEGRFYAYSKAGTANDFGVVPLGELNVERVVSCNKNGQFLAGTKVGFVPLQVFKAGSALDCMSGYNTIFKSDRNSCFGAVLCDGEVRFFAFDSEGKLFERYRTEVSVLTSLKKGAIDVLDDGRLVCYDATQITILDSAGEVFGVFEVAAGEQNVTVLDGGQLHYGRIKDGVFSRFRLVDGQAELLEEVQVGVQATIFGGVNSIGLSSKTIGRYYTIAFGGGANQAILTNIWTALGDALKVEFGMQGCAIYLANGQKVLTPVNASGLAVSVDENSSIIIFNEFFLVDSGASKKLYVFDRVNGAFKSVSGQFSAESIVDGVSLGDYLAVKRTDGSVETFYKNRSIAYAFNPSIAALESVTMVLRVCGNTFEGSRVNVKVGVEIE